MKLSATTKKRVVKKGAHAAIRTSQNRLLSGIRLMNDRSAVVVFLALLVVILFLFDSLSDQTALNPGVKDGIKHKLVTESVANDLISGLKVDGSGANAVGFIVKDTVDQQLLNHFTSMDYEQIKAKLGVESDFVIHFEDESGRVIQLGNKWCIGSNTAKVNGVSCS